MNTKSLTLTVLAVVAAIGLNAQATMQPTGTPQEERVSQHSLKLAEELGLDQDQTERMAKADMHYATAMAALRSVTNDREVLVQKGEELRQEHEQSLRSILTPEQMDKLNSIRMAKAQQGRTKMESISPPPTE